MMDDIKESDPKKQSSHTEKSGVKETETLNGGSDNKTTRTSNIWERSQSDANLIPRVLLDNYKKLKDDSSDEPYHISEQSRVYWDLPGAFKEPPSSKLAGGQRSTVTSGRYTSSCLSMSSSVGAHKPDSLAGDISRSISLVGSDDTDSDISAELNRRVALETIHQKKLLTQFHSTDCLIEGSSVSSKSCQKTTVYHRTASYTLAGNTFSRSVDDEGQHNDTIAFESIRPKSVEFNYENYLQASRDNLTEQLSRLRETLGDKVSPSSILSEEKVNITVVKQVQALSACISVIHDTSTLPQDLGRSCLQSLAGLVRSEGMLAFLASQIADALSMMTPPPSPVVDSSDASASPKPASTGSQQGDKDLPLLFRSSQLRKMVLAAGQFLSYILTRENLNDLMLSGSPNDSSEPPAGSFNKSTESSKGENLMMKKLVEASWIFKRDPDLSRVFSAILEGMSSHQESTCSLVVQNNGLRSLIFACRSTDGVTLRHAATALAGLALYGGSESHSEMVKSRVIDWLFPLAFHADHLIKYYACIAIVLLSVNKQYSATVHASGCLSLVTSFLRHHTPEELSKRFLSPHLQSDDVMAHVMGPHWEQDDWVLHLLPALLSSRPEAQALAAFHLAMEMVQPSTREVKAKNLASIGALEPLREAASSPHPLVSKFSCQTLLALGEPLPHLLSDQVPLWTVNDVTWWIRKIGFEYLADKFCSCRVDGDILLSLTDRSLLEDLGIENGITRSRLLRELHILQRLTNYSSCDTSCLSEWLKERAGPGFVRYVYPMVKAGVTRSFLPRLTDKMLRDDCLMNNGVHRAHLLASIKQATVISSPLDPVSPATKIPASPNRQSSLDVFISYRRSTGSQLASLLRVHLQLRGLRVFLDIERLSAGKFDETLIRSIRSSANFVIVLTPCSLDRCCGDDDCKDWIHREVCCALQSKCNIIPIMDRFDWPSTDSLPEDMRQLVSYNGVQWIHDYQEACVDKIEKFLVKPPTVFPFMGGDPDWLECPASLSPSPQTCICALHQPFYKSQQ